MESVKTRSIWAFADAHIGNESGGKDGAEWLQLAVEDIRAELSPDYVVNLGDMTAKHKEEEFARYARIRNESGIGPWYEVVGNHDFRGIEPGLYSKYIRCPRYWTLRDGNLFFVSLPAEQSNAEGLYKPHVDKWLRKVIGDAGEANVIICAHTFPRNTVPNSEKDSRHLHPAEVVKSFLSDIHIDIWLGGHLHSAPKSELDTVYQDGVLFVNTASVSHVYGTKASNSYLIEFEKGENKFRLKCRDHERRRFVEKYSIEGNLRYPVLPGVPEFCSYQLD